MAEKQKLTILTVEETQAIGDKGAEKLAFIAKDGEGKELQYFTFSKRLFNTIRGNIDKQIEVDVEVTERPSKSGTFIDRKVTEVYIDGKPLAHQGSGGRQWYGKSELEIASIEAQVAVKAAVELIIADKIPSNSPLALAANDWLFLKLGVKPLSKVTATKQVGGKPLDTPRQIEIDGVEVASEGHVPTPLQRFKDECLRYGWDSEIEAGKREIRGWLKRHFGDSWKDLTLEAQESAIILMEALADEKE